ncbi:probable 3-ketoacyl-CoA synthase 21 [Primulina eburnea]|uniref:probable 3-ketoacyl-CoA synthase 21 n=1 Tax=Primulina eburnea TaxID=1245227 RepID=UPI003C6BEABA
MTVWHSRSRFLKNQVQRRNVDAPSLFRVSITKSLSFNKDEAEMVIFSLVKGTFGQEKHTPESNRHFDHKFLYVFCHTITCSNGRKQVQNEKQIMSFNLSGMGCSAGIISIGLARDLLRVHRKSLALILSTEFMSMNWYTGTNRSMLLSNCLSEWGCRYINVQQIQDRRKAKYTLQHVVRTNIARDDKSYTCIYQEEDHANKNWRIYFKDI